MVTIRAKLKHYGPLQIDDTGATGITLQTSTGATLTTGIVVGAIILAAPAPLYVLAGRGSKSEETEPQLPLTEDALEPHVSSEDSRE